MVCVLLLPCKIPLHSCIFPLLKCAITTNPVTGSMQICYLHIRPGVAATCIWTTWKDLHYSTKFPYFKQKCHFHLGLTNFSINYALCPPLNNHISYSNESKKKSKIWRSIFLWVWQQSASSLLDLHQEHSWWPNSQWVTFPALELFVLSLLFDLYLIFQHVISRHVHFY